MATIKVSQKSLTKYSIFYRWNGHFGYLSEVIKIPKYQFWIFWTLAFIGLKLLSVMTLTLNAKARLPDPLTRCKYDSSPEKYLTTADGKIRCRRCKAESSRTKLQCAKPALKGKAVCQFYVGKSTGPRAKEGKDRIRTTLFRHGEETL